MKNDVIGQGRNRDKATFSEERMINLLVRRPDMTYQETGDSIGVSKRTVHRIARKARLRRNSKPRRYRSDIYEVGLEREGFQKGKTGGQR